MQVRRGTVKRIEMHIKGLFCCQVQAGISKTSHFNWTIINLLLHENVETDVYLN